MKLRFVVFNPAEQQIQKHPALKKGPVSGATLFLGGLCTVMTAVIIILSTNCKMTYDS